MNKNSENQINQKSTNNKSEKNIQKSIRADNALKKRSKNLKENLLRRKAN